MNKKLNETGKNFRPQLGEPIKRLAQQTMKRHAELETETDAVRFLVMRGYEMEFGKPAPEKAQALIEGEVKA